MDNSADSNQGSKGNIRNKIGITILVIVIVGLIIWSLYAIKLYMENNELEKEIAELETRISNIQDESSANSAEMAAKKIEIANLNQRLNSLKEKRNSTKSLLSTFNKDTQEELQEYVVSLQEKLETRDNKIGQLETKIENSQENIEQHEERIAELTRLNRELKQDFDEQKSRIEQKYELKFQEQKDKYEDQINKINAQLSSHQQKADSCENARADYEKKINKLQQEYEQQIDKLNQELAKETSGPNQEISKHEQEISRLTRELQGMTKKYNVLNLDYKRAQEKLQKESVRLAKHKLIYNPAFNDRDEPPYFIGYFDKSGKLHTYVRVGMPSSAQNVGAHNSSLRFEGRNNFGEIDEFKSFYSFSSIFKNASETVHIKSSNVGFDIKPHYINIFVVYTKNNKKYIYGDSYWDTQDIDIKLISNSILNEEMKDDVKSQQNQLITRMKKEFEHEMPELKNYYDYSLKSVHSENFKKARAFGYVKLRDYITENGAENEAVATHSYGKPTTDKSNNQKGRVSIGRLLDKMSEPDIMKSNYFRYNFGIHLFGHLPDGVKPIEMLSKFYDVRSQKFIDNLALSTGAEVTINYYSGPPDDPNISQAYMLHVSGDVEQKLSKSTVGTTIPLLTRMYKKLPSEVDFLS